MEHMKKTLFWIAVFVAGAVTPLILGLSPIARSSISREFRPKFYVVVTDYGDTYLAKSCGTDKVEACLYDTYYFAKSSDASKPPVLHRMQDEAYWPARLEVPLVHVKMILPVNIDSPIGKLLEAQK
jgi:hypothetical protein